MAMLKQLPNLMTLFRITGSILLLYLEPLTPAFYIFYLLCGASDMLDGFIARRFRVISRFGAALDSVADTVFVLALAFVLLPMVILPLFIWLWLAGIAVIKLTSLITGFFKYRSLAFLHTYANKIAGITLFLFPLAYGIWREHAAASAGILCAIASIAALEELIINMTSSKLDPDIKSWF
ncbi:CDP-alcohol phosphatidyltransferase family protein [Paenibacillus oryzae]|uniref:CDP-alcohol phosphatidyltransferase family protein n=1 Tax=Paenibacillus oryzae TaxID=1844972 RepID=UPI001FDFD68C|nr:CDP-alcohol phosphatidyltransferase family protein [Paenibacillus oryzae]